MTTALHDASRSPRHRARPRPTAAEVIAIVERAARLPDGLALLEASPLECAAVLLGVDPRALERLRAVLAEPSLRDEVRLALAQLAAARPPRAEPRPAAPAAPRDAEALLAAAAGRPGGVSLLLTAAAECAAVVFGVHPDLVLRARDLAARRGHPRDPSAEG